MLAQGRQALDGLPAYLFAYEDISGTNKPFEVTTQRTLLLLENASRYKAIGSAVFLRLERLAMFARHKALVDIVPFTVDIKYLYVPYSHLGRQILGHQHWYAFREGFKERTASGDLVDGLDFAILAGKIAPYTELCYPAFFTNPTDIISSPLTAPEREAYQVLRDKLFAENRTANPIITTLADYTNTRPSRRLRLAELVHSLSGRTITYTNIQSHNAALRKLCPEVRTFYTSNGDEDTADHVILAEVPIVRGYLFLDVLANLQPSCTVHVLTGPTTVDKYLFGRMQTEHDSVNRFVAELWRVLHA